MLINVVHRLNRVLLLLVLWPLNVMAAETVGDMPSTMQASTLGAANLNSGYLVQLVVGLLFVLLCIVALAWLAKRVNRMQSSSDGALQVLGGISMGARERVVLVQIGTTQLLLGVAPGRINMLHQLEQPIEKADSAVNSSIDMPLVKGFAEKLNSALSRNER